MRSCTRLLLIAVILLAMGCRAWATSFPGFYFQNITTAEGLSSNEITCLYQDRAGFLWVGTTFGLNRYDGNSVMRWFHESDDTNSLSGNHIASILEDHQGILWIATKDGGLTRFDRSQFRSKQFRHFTHNPSDKNSITTNRLTCLMDFDEDFLFVGTEATGGFYLHKKTFAIRNVTIGRGEVTSLDPRKQQEDWRRGNWTHYAEKKDSLYYFTFLSGSYVFELSRSNMNLAVPRITQGVSFNVSSFTLDGSRAWLASWNFGLVMQDGFLTDTLNIPPQYKVVDIQDEIISVLNWDSDFLLAGSKATGLYVVNKHNYSYQNIRNTKQQAYGPASNRINCLFRDRQGILWAGTSNGLSKFNPQQWQFNATPLRPDASSELIHFSLREEEDGTLRLCTSEGIYKRKPGGESFQLVQFNYLNRQQAVTYIFQYHDQFYLCTENNFFHYYPSEEKIRPPDLASSSGKVGYGNYFRKYTLQVRNAVADTVFGNPLILLGILGDGLGVYDLSKQDISFYVKLMTLPGSLGDNLIRCLGKDRSGNVWVGTSGGLYRWKKSFPLQNQFDAFVHAEADATSIPHNNITGLLATGDDHLWVTTAGGGLAEFDGKIFHHYSPADEAGRNMLGICADSEGRFWIPTPAGFEVFNPATKKFRHLALPDADWSLRFPTQIYRSKSGRISYGSGNRLITFHPDSFYFESSEPSVYLTDFKVMDQSIFETSAFANQRYPYNRNFFTIHYSALQLSQPAMVQYAYKLEGLNQDWITSKRLGQVSYTSLPPGHYAFKVKATNAAGEWGNEVLLASFTVLKPYWQTWWFYLGCLLVASGIVYLWFQIRLRQILRLQEVRQRIASDLHDDIGSALSSISISTQLVKKFSSQEEAKVNRLLNQINSTSRETLDSMSDIVWAINPKNDSGYSIVAKMQRVATDLLESKGMHVTFTCDENFERLKLGMEGRKNLFLIFKEAVNNASKHSSGHNINIELYLRNQKLVMKVEDDGKGFNVTPSALGNGIESLKNRAHQLGGTLTIESLPGNGTSLILETDITKIRD
jgi:two-component sensor histidine kinase/streptogramin lyase